MNVQLVARAYQASTPEKRYPQWAPEQTPAPHRHAKSLLHVDTAVLLENIVATLLPVSAPPAGPQDRHHLPRRVRLVPEDAVAVFHQLGSHSVMRIHQHLPQRREAEDGGVVDGAQSLASR